MMGGRARRNEIATRIVLHDCTERTADLCHFRGTGMLILNMQMTRWNEMRLTTTGAHDLARILDHFARHEDLPDWLCAEGELGHGVHCGAGI